MIAATSPARKEMNAVSSPARKQKQAKTPPTDSPLRFVLKFLLHS